MAISLDGLSMPSELLINILGFLDATHRPSLHAIALVNKRLHSVAVGFLLRKITIYMHNSELLIETLQLLTPTVLENVRHLILEGSMYPLTYSGLEVKRPYRQLASYGTLEDLSAISGQFRRFAFWSAKKQCIDRSEEVRYIPLELSPSLTLLLAFGCR